MLTEAIKTVLRREPGERSDSDLRLLSGLAHRIPSFHAYSPYVQFELCRTLRLYTYESDRVITCVGSYCLVQTTAFSDAYFRFPCVSH